MHCSDGIDAGNMGQVSIWFTVRLYCRPGDLAGAEPLAGVQAMSFGLTQYDVEELMDHCNGRCKHLCDPLVLPTKW